jgi:hypothetical protein
MNSGTNARPNPEVQPVNHIVISDTLRLFPWNDNRACP